MYLDAWTYYLLQLPELSRCLIGRKRETDFKAPILLFFAIKVGTDGKLLEGEAATGQASN
jgi:hypothetical protein